jgi:hypothetical protein
VIAVVAVLGLVIGLSAFGDTPDTRDNTDQVAAYFTDHRTSVLVGVVCVGLAILAFLDVVHRQVEGSAHVEDDRFARLAQSSAAVAASVVLVGLLLPYAGLAYVVGAESPESAKGIFSLTLVSTPLLALPLAVAFAAMARSGHRRGTARHWFTVVTAIAALLFAWGACSFRASGPMSPDVQQQVVFQTLVIWLVCAGVAGRRRRVAA